MLQKCLKLSLKIDWKIELKKEKENNSLLSVGLLACLHAKPRVAQLPSPIPYMKESNPTHICFLIHLCTAASPSHNLAIARLKSYERKTLLANICCIDLFVIVSNEHVSHLGACR